MGRSPTLRAIIVTIASGTTAIMTVMISSIMTAMSSFAIGRCARLERRRKNGVATTSTAMTIFTARRRRATRGHTLITQLAMVQCAPALTARRKAEKISHRIYKSRLMAS
jgi:hypothetical protein